MHVRNAVIAWQSRAMEFIDGSATSTYQVDPIQPTIA